MFADTATVEIRAGKGGDGRSSFRHEKYRAMGGSDGGDGGKGGDVIFVVDHNAHALAAYRTKRKIVAEDGNVGGSNRKHGRNGEDVYVPVPEGTQVWDGEELVADLTKDGQTAILAKGGRGGYGNAHFVSSTRQAPRTAELGEMGEAKTLRLELKLVADVGFIGLPNAGKSTLLSVITNARPEIADYAFTTLVPNLGVVTHRDYTFLVADIPGLIEGASEGKGLGDEFLRHVERTSVLLHLIDAGSDDIVRDYNVIRGELASYQIDLSTRPQIVVVSKSDTVDEAKVKSDVKALQKATNDHIYVISAQAHRDLDPLLDEALAQVKLAREARDAQEAEAEIPVIDEAALPDLWQVHTESDGAYRVSGERIEGFARRTNFDQDDGVERLRDILRKTGVARELRRQGVEDRSIIRIGDHELEWIA